MIGAGLLVGAWYALLAALRKLFDAGFLLTLMMDVLFGIGAALILSAALMLGNYGSLRFYELLGAVLGIVLFALGTAPPIQWFSHHIVRRIRHIFGKISRNRLIKVIFR